MYFFAPTIFVGIEITDKEVKLLKLKRNQHQYCIEDYTTIVLPQHAILHGKIKQIEPVKMALQQSIKQTRSKWISAAMALPSQTVVSKHIFLAKGLTDLEVETEIQVNLHHYVPGIQQPLAFDFKKIFTVHAELDEFFFVATPHEIVEQYVHLASAAKLKLQIIDINSLALRRFAAACENNFSGFESANFTEIKNNYALSLGLAMRGLHYDGN